MFFTSPVPHAEAVDAIKNKTLVTRRVFDRLLPELQEAAFTVSGVECFDSLQRIRDAIASVPAGANWDDAKWAIEQELEPWLDNAVARERRAELLLRLHGFRAYAATNYQLMEAHKGTFPWRQYIATNDTNVRDTHAALHGKVFPADHPFWDTHTGPWEWGCRCEAVALLPEEVADMQAEDKIKRLPPEAWRVVPQAILDRVEQTGFIDVGPHEQGGVKKSQGVYDIRTPREKTGDPNAFEWRPGEIGMPLKKVKERYDDATWSAWEKWAKRTKLPDGRSLWKAMNNRGKATAAAPPQGGTPTAPEPSPAAVVAPAAAPVVPAAPKPGGPAIPAGGAAVSAAFPDTLDARLKVAGDLIDSVHGDGQLRPAPVEWVAGTAGSYNPSGRIRVGRGGAAPLAQFIHELGHKLDMEALPGSGLTSESGTALSGFLTAVKSTAAYKELDQEGRDKGVRPSYMRYQKREAELWARAYMQFIAEETQDADLLKAVRDRRENKTDYLKNSQWETADFAPVKAEIRRIMTVLGWIQPDGGMV